jgi:glycosyltransferase involved in cell wall biosynthesis
MSVPVEEAPARIRNWADGGTLRLLHIGKVASLPGFRSLQFLLRDVLPRLDRAVLERIQLHVVGEVAGDARGAAILELARPFPQVRFEGFQEDLRSWYASSDLQLVGCTEATGLRTRIVESFAYGLPVLSTSVGAAGVAGLRPDHNILLADDPGEFAAIIGRLLATPDRLATLADAGRSTYAQTYSRSVVASTLRELLDRHLAE